MTTDAKGALQGIKSIEVGIRLLSALTSARGGQPLRDLAKSANMSPSKAHRYLASFMNVGLVEQDSATRNYRLGPFAFELGLAAIGSSDHLNDAIRTQITLRDELDETVVLTVWGSHGPTVLRVEESSHPVIMTMKVGVTLPLMHSAAGRIFAAFMPRRIIESYLQVANFSAAIYGRRGAIRYADIEPKLCEIRHAGLSLSSGEVLRGVSAVAGPLLAPNGQLVGALAVIGQQDSLDMSANGHVARMLIHATTAYVRSAAMGANTLCFTPCPNVVKGMAIRPTFTEFETGPLTRTPSIRRLPLFAKECEAQTRNLPRRGNIECRCRSCRPPSSAPTRSPNG